MPDHTKNTIPVSESRKALLSPLNTQFSSPGSPQTFMASPISYSHDVSPKDASRTGAQNVMNTPSPLRQPLEKAKGRREVAGEGGKAGMSKGFDQVVTVEDVDDPQYMPPPGVSDQSAELRSPRHAKSQDGHKVLGRRSSRKGKEREQDQADLPIWTEEDGYLEREEQFFKQGGYRQGDNLAEDNDVLEENDQPGRPKRNPEGDSPMLTELRRKMDNILDAQAEIRNMHERLESVGSDLEPEVDKLESGRASTTTSPNLGSGTEDKAKKGTGSNGKDDEGATPGSKEAKKAGKIRQRQDELDQMFDKLSNLSTMLKEYHSLPQPSLFFPTSLPTNPSSPNTPTNPFTDPGKFPSSTSTEPPPPSQRTHTTSHSSTNPSFVHGRREKEPRPIIIPMSSPELETAPLHGKDAAMARGRSSPATSSAFPVRRSTEPHISGTSGPIDPTRSGKGRLAEMGRPETGERKWSTVLN